MGLMRFLFGLGPELRQTAEVFVANKTQAAAQNHSEHLASLQQLGAEFAQPKGGWFSDLIDGLNRVPRPALALGTLGLFTYAMADPVAFGIRMQGLALVPEPLWWLLGAIVSFYFGARELHYFRGNRAEVSPESVGRTVARIDALRENHTPTMPASDPASDLAADMPMEPQPLAKPSTVDPLPHEPTPTTGAVVNNAALREWLVRHA